MVGKTLVQEMVKLAKLLAPALKEFITMVLKKAKGHVVEVCGAVFRASRSFIKRVFGNFVQTVWDRVFKRDTQEKEKICEKVEQWREKIAKLRKERKEKKEAEEERKKEAEEEKTEAEEERKKEAEQEKREEEDKEEEEKETKWKKLDEAMEKWCDSGNPFA
ncbi:hypothetical protein Bca4012_062306 [Brassica carinata]|uniref:Uncharacterized protein n=1 Tax=Brassica carinata TaxID=52824 RepID=A0A8X7SDR7_BRACI|nr:hypothetical protein Bca52824_032216 [Brassica carinata]